MNRTTKTITSLLVTGAAAFGVVGCGSSSGESTTQAAATTQAAQGTQAQAGQGRGGPALSSADLATAAKALGTTSAKLQAAMEAARPTGRPSATSGTTGSGGAAGTSGAGAGGSGGSGGAGEDPRTTMYAAIAKDLGTTSAKVEAALADLMPTGGRGGPGGGGSGGAPPSGAPGADSGTALGSGTTGSGATGSDATGTTGSDATGTTSVS